MLQQARLCQMFNNASSDPLASLMMVPNIFFIYSSDPEQFSDKYLRFSRLHCKRHICIITINLVALPTTHWSLFLYVRRRVLCYPNDLCYFLRLSWNFFLGFSDLPDNVMTNNLYFCDSVIDSVVSYISKYHPEVLHWGICVPKLAPIGRYLDI